jgi:hypothetical protein
VLINFFRSSTHCFLLSVLFTAASRTPHTSCFLLVSLWAYPLNIADGGSIPIRMSGLVSQKIELFITKLRMLYTEVLNMIALEYNGNLYFRQRRRLQYRLKRRYFSLPPGGPVCNYNLILISTYVSPFFPFLVYFILLGPLAVLFTLPR